MFVDGDGYREILGAAEGVSESKECRKSFLLSLKERGLKGGAPVHLGQAPGHPGIRIGGLPECRMATQYKNG